MINQAKKTNPAIAIAKALLKSLFMAIAIGAISVIVIKMDPKLGKLGTLLMFTGSCLMVLLTARKKFPLNTITCVLPGAMVLSCFVLQLFLPIADKKLLSPIGLIAGVLVGLILGLIHKINEEKGRLIAKRSLGYVLIWILAFMVTQTSSLWGIEKIARVGLVLSGFSTAMLTAMSLLLLIRYRHRVHRLVPAMASSTKIAGILLIIFLSTFTTLAFAQITRVSSAQQATPKLLSSRDMPAGYHDEDTDAAEIKSLWDQVKTSARREGFPPPLDVGCHAVEKSGLAANLVNVILFYFEEQSHARLYAKSLLNIDTDRKKLVTVSNCGDSCTLRILYGGEISEGFLVRGNWLVWLTYMRQSELRGIRNPEQKAISDIERIIRLVDGRLSQITYSGPGTQQSSRRRQQTSQQQQPTSQPGVRLGSFIDFIRDFFPTSEELKDKADDVGKAAAVIQLAFSVLMSTLIAASEAASQGVAAFQGVAGLYPVKDTTIPPTPPTVSTQILDGQKAITWLQDRNMLDKDGTLTEKFNTWLDQSHGDTRTDLSNLEGFAGNINRIRPDGKEGPIVGGKLDGDIAIIVREPAPSRAPSPEPPSEPISTTPSSLESIPETEPSPEPSPETKPSTEPIPEPTLSRPETATTAEQPDPYPSPTSPPVAGPLPETEPDLKLTPAWLERNPLLAQNPNSMFTPDFMKNQVDIKFQGADSDKLSNSMYELTKSPQGQALDSVLKNIADIRGRPIDQIKSEYRKYQELQKQRDDNKPGGAAELSSYLHPKFMGSSSQLRSGQIVGTAFGIDPVFGAMLNPTGGLVGPANWSIDANNSAVGYHGAMHDAAGYLYNFHKVGPGYDYLRMNQPRDTASPLSGQSEGIRMWRETLGEKSDIASGPAEHGIRFIVAATDTAQEAIRWGIDITDLEPAGNYMAEKFKIF